MEPHFEGASEGDTGRPQVVTSKAVAGPEYANSRPTHLNYKASNNSIETLPLSIGGLKVGIKP